MEKYVVLHPLAYLVTSALLRVLQSQSLGLMVRFHIIALRVRVKIY